MVDIKTDWKNRLHVAWVDASGLDGQGTDADIAYKYWDLDQDIWSGITVPNQGVTASNDSYYAHIDVSGDGKAQITWS